MFKNGNAWLLPAFWATLLFIASSIPDLNPDKLAIKLSDKSWHIFVYMPLGYLLRFAISRKPGPFAGMPAFWALALGMLYGLFDEIHQSFVPGRYMDVLDVIADGIGSALGVCLFRLQQYVVIRNRGRIG